MLAAERRARISELVRAQGTVSTEDLAVAVDVSVETIRRDLLDLETRGMIARVHGGATVPGSVVASESTFAVRKTEERERKRRIARAAAELVPDGCMLMIDVGSTALLAARSLPASLSAFVVTTSLRVAVELAERPNLDILIAGGRVRPGDLAASGATTMDVLSRMHFDIALLGSGGVHAEAGLTDYYLEEAEYRRVVVAQTTASYVLCDATKFNKVARHTVAPLGGFTGLVVDEEPPPSLRAALTAAGTRVVVAD